MKAVIVFTGRTEFEAQLARDLLESSLIPVFHVPGLTTGVFGMRQDTRVAVPEDQVAAAIEILREAGLEAGETEPPRGIAEFTGAFRQAFPDRGGHSTLLRVVLVLVVGWLIILLVRRFL